MEEIVKDLKKIKTKKNEDDGLDECEPVSPCARLFKQINCHVICLFGCKHEIDIQELKNNVENSPLFKHKRFSSILKAGRKGKLRWVPTKANIDDHIIVPQIDLSMNSENCVGFVEDYAAKLGTAPPLDPSKPLWQLHVLNMKSAEAEATMIFRIHHCIGDGVSLMSLCFACSRKTNDPKSLPTLPRPAQRPTRPISLVYLIFMLFLRFLLMMYFSFQDSLGIVGTLSNFIRDSNTPIKGSDGVGSMPKRLAHVCFSLEDVKTIKNAVNGTVNDVIIGTLAAGLVRYLDRIYASREQTLPSNLLVRLAMPVNTRAVPGLQELADLENKKEQCRWGNDLGFFIISLPLQKYEDPLQYAQAAKIICKKKKSSLEMYITYLTAYLSGQMSENIWYRMSSNTTLTFSNTVAPEEEIDFFGQSITYIAPTTVGQPHSLAVYFMSYMGKVRLVVTSAEEFMPDPERLCLDCVESLGHMKQAAAAKTNGLLRKL
ncbi:hypothetical protein SUGI_0452200 [Cryptomeria japonica]|uniref:wax ester synthase/diacylglycerol acyltransferase 5 n=1 Tax=Cryptomeria japonica TaxID=3369 RepID=UPI002408ECEE|nr:wax ester synthase/diacylglycerol acyltransferase 5 [Cryptomeria japonica]GLJ23825.1 hypothetical protein SUGI_0452200 [Cryptomeria japonica]